MMFGFYVPLAVQKWHRFQASRCTIRTTRARTIRIVLGNLTFFRRGAEGISNESRDHSRKGWQGPYEYKSHRVPVGAMILDAKYCEMCGRNFLRRAQSKNRYCSKCRPRFSP